MATEKQTTATSGSSFGKGFPFYIGDTGLPDLPPSVRKFFEEYSGIPAARLRSHVLELRERAWQIFPYPSIGRVRFLDFSLSVMPSYSKILLGLSSKEDAKTLLDAGSCFGQDLRKLVVDGAPGAQLVGVELKPEFTDLGYDLFLDRGKFEGRFSNGDIFEDTPGSIMKALDGTIDIVHISLCLHLFGWDEQLKAAVRLVGFLKNKPETIMLGRQVGCSKPGEYARSFNPGGVTYSHDQETFHKLWIEVEKQTMTKWKLETSLQTVATGDSTVEMLYFEATRTE